MDNKQQIQKQVADAFNKRMRSDACKLNYSLTTLADNLEAILNNKHHHLLTFSTQTNIHYDFITAISCYFGESLLTSYKGQWQEECYDSNSTIFYTLSMQFGEVKFNPIIYFSYRLENGVEDTGNVEAFLKALTPSIKDGIKITVKKIWKRLGIMEN